MAVDETTKEEQAQAEVTAEEPDDFSTLLKQQFKPQNTRAQQQIEHAVQTLAEHVLQDVSIVSPDVVNTIETIKSRIDEMLTHQQEEFPVYESTGFTQAQYAI